MSAIIGVIISESRHRHRVMRTFAVDVSKCVRASEQRRRVEVAADRGINVSQWV